MDDSKNNWGIVIFLIILFAVFWSGGFGRGGFGPANAYPYANPMPFNGYNLGFEDYKSVCEAQKANIAQTATTQYLIEQQANQTRELVNSTASATQAKIDFYAYQDLRDKVSELQRENLELRSQAYTTAALAPVNEKLNSVLCKMLPRPELSGIAAVCPNAAVINGLNNGCGTL